ncbi:hypothetical protein T310_1528 [Rasamsonia emersonii CBS 393.64]|uniref:Uncharacterized protein n=1 Tax=Rasamsonia emersonii (strain ATCC 16479 / CBS 393.64 / IMI 116815) TaxID=1408163 RepID=A0A0F4Z1W3_RASE3|nr:hypothetical protein T310_1528 [Rasamsonia emersonii CBS 393.64]KKA24499.1 hypothetical protein T310_1528 [Rasamsonia emersonii CBS 393.64]
MSSRWLAKPALSVLYQLYDTSPVTGGGTEEEQLRTKRTTGTTTVTAGGKDEQNSIIRKWALMWRSIILSTFERTYLPYYSYIRYLDLEDLKHLVSDPSFKGQIREEFFSGEIGDYIFRDYETKGSKRLRSSRTSPDAIWIVQKVGSAITQKAKSIRELSGEIPPSALTEWIRNLPELQALSLWSGNSLSHHAEDEIRVHCPDFKKVALFRWSDSPSETAESESEQFLKGLRPNSLEYFEVISYSHLGPRSIAALGSHLKSLVELKLTSLPLKAIAELPSLTAPPALKVLSLTDSLPELRNEEFYKTVSDVAEWICSCKNLRRLELRRFLDDPVLLSKVLIDDRVRLNALHVVGYSMQSARAFHEALASQSSLQVLSLQGEGSEWPQDQEVLVQALGQLSELLELELKEISEYFTPDHIMSLTPYLPHLERLWISGYDFNDQVWDSFLCLPRLRYLVIHALSDFTAQGILDFISQLGPGNRGFYLSILNAMSDTSITEEAQTVIRDTLAQNLDGSFDFGLAREEFTDSELGSDIS